MKNYKGYIDDYNRLMRALYGDDADEHTIEEAVQDIEDGEDAIKRLASKWGTAEGERDDLFDKLGAAERKVEMLMGMLETAARENCGRSIELGERISLRCFIAYEKERWILTTPVAQTERDSIADALAALEKENQHE